MRTNIKQQCLVSAHPYTYFTLYEEFSHYSVTGEHSLIKILKIDIHLTSFNNLKCDIKVRHKDSHSFPKVSCDEVM